jgi:hypothetical protein
MNKFNELIEKINSEPINESSGGYSKTLDKVISNMESATKSLKEIQSKMDKLKKIKDWNSEQKDEFNELIASIDVILNKQARDRSKIQINNRA